MDKLNLSQEEFKRDHDLQERNWFYIGTTEIWFSFLQAALKKAEALHYALDVGCGVGGKISYLKRLADCVFGLDLSIDALEFCRERRLSGLTLTSVEILPYKNSAFSLVNLFDVLEHIEDDLGALKGLHRIISDKGCLVILVPAFKSLWSQHDVANCHKRRYMAAELKEKLEKCGFKIERMSYVNSFIFPLARVYRFFQKKLSSGRRLCERTRVENVPGWLNSFLKFMLKLESRLIKVMNFPFGVSLLCIARKIDGDSLNQKFLDILICPKCRKPFKREDYADSGLVCRGCSSVYPVVSGIPRFVDGRLSENKRKTAKNFGYSWKAFSRCYDFYSEQFLDWIWPVTQDDLRDKFILDAGCGNGRHIWQSVKFGAREVVGFDLSESIDVAYNNTKELSNVYLLQADIYNLPLREFFDYVYCIGVLHHLPNPEDGFHCLVKLLKKGGRISVWVYAKEGNGLIRKFIDPVRLHITSKMPLGLLKLLSLPLASALYLITKFIIRPLNASDVGASLARYIPLNDYFKWLSQFNFRYTVNTVFDQLVAVTLHYIGEDEIEGWFNRAGLSDVLITRRNNNSWRGVGTKVV